MKAYIQWFRIPTADGSMQHARFTPRPEDAVGWSTGEEAENNRLSLARDGVRIQSAEGQIYWLYDFVVEETASGKFSIWCNHPFIGK
jgi:hypothetical protein